MILLDTDIMIDVLREYPPAQTWLKSLRHQAILLPGFVIMEFIQGCQNLSEQQTLMKTLTVYQSAWPSEASCNQALSTFQTYHLSHSLGIIDALIAQTAIERGLPLHTFNQKHYTMIPGLQTIQPYKRL
jgi:predicted nucleic acid-binding protein